MATPRRRYPSDHRPYFRVVDDILDDEKLQGEEWMLSAYIRALAMLNRAHSRDGSIRVSHSTLEAMMGRRRRDVALTRLRRCVNVGLMLAARYADYTLIFIPNWPKIQGFTPAELRCDSGATPALRVEEKRVNPREEKSMSASPSAPTHKQPKERVRRGVTKAPEDLDPEQKRGLLEWAKEHDPEAIPRLRELVDACLDHFRAKGKPMADWTATCRAWIRNRDQFSKGNGSAKYRPVTFHEQSVLNTKQGARDAMAILDARRQEEQDERIRIEAGLGAEAHPTHPLVLGPRH